MRIGLAGQLSCAGASGDVTNAATANIRSPTATNLFRPSHIIFLPQFGA
jgi:hypothetical protein